MKTTSLLLTAAALVLGPSHGLAQEVGEARSQEEDRCDVTNVDGACLETTRMSEDRAEFVEGAGSGEPDAPASASNMAPGYDGTAGGP
jgi:hypothetical protein